MIEWRNLKKLHANARETIKVQNELIRVQAEQIHNQGKLISNQAQMIENLKLQIEELRTIIFGKKKKNKSEDSSGNNGNDPDSSFRSQANRSSGSYHRPLPNDEDITKKEFHPVSLCHHCKHKLTRKTTASFYEEDIPLPIQKVVIRHSVEKGYCPKCNQYSVGLDLPSAKVILGKRTKIYICYLSIIPNLSLKSSGTDNICSNNSTIFCFPPCSTM
mgnify:CR=1 FL=1